MLMFKILKLKFLEKAKKLMTMILRFEDNLHFMGFPCGSV